MKKDVYGLSKPQESIWLTEQYFKDDNINRFISLIDFSPKIKELDFELLNKALNNMVRQNDNFQIRLFLENGEIKQRFCEFEEFQCEIYEVDSAEEFAEQNSREQNVFNLLESPLYKFKLFRIKGTKTGGILSNIHHIICDGYGTGLAMRQTYESYMSLIENNTLPDLNPEKNSYKEYLEAEKEYIRSNKFIKDKEYWDEIYKTIPEVATIYSNKKSNKLISSEADRVSNVIAVELMTEIKELCEDLKISVYNFFMAVFGIYISRASNLNDFAIGTPILNRTNYKEKNTIGMYVSTVPFRMTLNENMSFAEFSEKIAKDSMGMLRHQKYSYGYILENLRKQKNDTPSLYNIVFSYQISRAADENSRIYYEMDI